MILRTATISSSGSLKQPVIRKSAADCSLLSVATTKDAFYGKSPGAALPGTIPANLPMDTAARVHIWPRQEKKTCCPDKRIKRHCQLLGNHMRKEDGIFVTEPKSAVRYLAQTSYFLFGS